MAILAGWKLAFVVRTSCGLADCGLRVCGANLTANQISANQLTIANSETGRDVRTSLRTSSVRTESRLHEVRCNAGAGN